MNVSLKNNTVRRERERREVRLKIIDAARELFTEGGEEGLTLRRVAERIEYSATTIYLHFPNKDALVRELCAADFAAFSRRLVQADRSNDPLDRLKKVMVGYVDFGLQHPGHYRAMFIAARTVDSPTHLQAGEGAKNEPDPHAFLQAAVFKGLAAGIFKAEYRDVPLLTQTLWAGLHGVIALHQVRTNHPAVAWRSVQTLTEMMIECLLNGMILPALATSPAWHPAG